MSLDQHMFGYGHLFHRFELSCAPSIADMGRQPDTVGSVPQELMVYIKPSMPALPAGIVRFALLLPQLWFGLCRGAGSTALGCHPEL